MNRTSLPILLPALEFILPPPLPLACAQRGEHPSFRSGSLYSDEVLLDGQVLEEYIIEGRTYTMQRPENEQEAMLSRKTIDGRTLTYKLNIIQQPQRARACGAGPRSAADRRPVDPPPVIELRIFEGEGHEKKDVTMSYDAGFLLHASLELSRPIANGQRFNPQVIPVLTGVPVAGTNYLDRPSPAAYFIFSDLSVRHEGWFRLKFFLFEKIKDPNDADIGKPFTLAPPDHGQSKMAPTPRPNEGMTNRMEVVSLPFQVWSAKKFPGLHQSTDLSRLVAEQGCRVRIRRDVRQRKRGPGAKDETDGYEDERNSYRATPEASMPPQTPIDRAHSSSRSDYGGSQTTADHYRRPSMDLPRNTILQPRIHNVQSPVRPAPTVYPAAAASALVDLSQAKCTQSSPMAPPPSTVSLAGPPALQYAGSPMDNTRHTPSSSRHLSEPKLLSYPTIPNRNAYPEIMIPDITEQRPESISREIVYDPVTGSYNPAPRPGSFNATTRQWQTREIGPKKRSYSPRTGTQEHPLKMGQRPDTLSPSVRASGIPPTEANYPSAISVNTLAVDDDEDSDDSSLFNSLFTYRRADGSEGRKPVEHMRKIYSGFRA